MRPKCKQPAQDVAVGQALPPAAAVITQPQLLPVPRDAPPTSQQFLFKKAEARVGPGEKQERSLLRFGFY